MEKTKLINILKEMKGEEVVFELVSEEGDTCYFNDIISISQSDEDELIISLPELKDFIV